MKKLLAATMLLSSVAAFAHDTWLLSPKGTLAPGDTLVLELTSAMEFPKPETAPKPDRIVATGLRLAGQTGTLAPQPADNLLRFTAPVAAAGVATAWIQTKPRTLDLTPDQVEHYLAEIGAPSAVRSAWEKSGKKTWRETYAKLAKAYARVGEPVGDRSWAEPAGLPLEIVPEADPTALKPGDELRVRVLRDGAPLPGLSIAAAGAGSPVVRTKTDADGRATLRLGSAGPWLLKATEIRPIGTTGTEWSSLFTTVTLHVRAADASR